MVELFLNYDDRFPINLEAQICDFDDNFSYLFVYEP